MGKKTLLAALAGLGAMAVAQSASAAGPYSGVLIFSKPSDGQFLAQLLDNRLPSENLHPSVALENVAIVNTILPLHVDILTGVGGAKYYHGTIITYSGSPIKLPCIGTLC